MTGTVCKSVFLVCFLFCTGCVTAPNISDRSGTQTVGTGQDETKDASVKESPAQAPVVARDIEAQEPELEAVKYLLDQAEGALDNKELERAGALLDRVLVIDRKAPRAYLVLAKTLYMENKPSQARATAQQGLLYTSKRTHVGQQLEKLARSD